MGDKEFRLSKTKFLLSEKYTLYLSWDKVTYNKQGICKIVGATFSGPALSIANKINPFEHILLDFFKQYFIHCQDVYIAKLSWGDVVYNNDGSVTLLDATIEHSTELNRVPKFRKSDVIVVDTSKHESAIHRFNPTYPCYVTKRDGLLYNFINPSIDTYEIRH